MSLLDWIGAHWPSLSAASGLLTILGGLVRFGPRTLRRLALLLDCEMDRIRWEEADRLRDGEIALLRRQVANLQTDLDRLLERSGVSGSASPAPAANGPTSAPSIPPATSGT